MTYIQSNNNFNDNGHSTSLKNPTFYTKAICIKGIQDEQLGELSVAYIVRENKNLTKEEVMEYCKGKLSKYKIPKTIKFVETISETYNGKIKRGV